MEQPPQRVTAWQQIIDQFNSLHPSIRVTQEVQDWNLIYPKIAAAVASGTQPDILFTIPDFTTYVRGIGAVQPVTALVQELDQAHGFLTAATAAYNDQGEYWAVPLYGMVQMLWYRRDLFEQAGITAPPATWEEMLAYTQKLTTGTQHGVVLPAGKNLATDQVIYSLMITAGAENLFDAQGNIVFDNPDTVRTFEFYNDLLQYAPVDVAAFSWGEPQALLNTGAAAMAIEKGQYLTPFTAESGRPASDLGCALIPQPATNGQAGSIYYSNAAMIMTSDQAKKEASAEFLRYLLQPDVYGLFLNAEPGLFLPLTQTGAEAESWLGHPIIEEYQYCVDLMLQQSQSGMLFGFTDGQYQIDIGLISGQNILAQTIQRMFIGGESAQDAVTWGQGQMEAALE
ncbi:MAG TPA: extracellular solute-binding protein [Patescibacteria group bacterium]|nr:extracellular solute-binding protein [Patescibacteria group bacterium]